MARSSASGVKPWRVELAIYKAHIEAGIMRHNRCIADKFEKCISDFGKQRLLGEKLVFQAMDDGSLHRHFALRIKISLPGAPCRHMVHQLHAADFNDTVAEERVEAGGFCVEDDFAHKRGFGGQDSGVREKHTRNEIWKQNRKFLTPSL